MASFLSLFFLAPWAAAETILSSETGNAAPKPLSPFDQYIQKFDKKFDRGGFNFVMGWTEILRQPALYYKSGTKKNRGLKAVQGFGVGLWNGTADTVGGFTNALTSLFPNWEIPLPKGGLTSEDITGGNPDSFQSEDEYKGTSPARTSRAVYPS